MWGVTVVICSHNSAERLPKTLEHLAAQQVRTELEWEVVVIDNASTDGTANLALVCWPSVMRAPLRVVQEPRLGLTYARCRGLDEARYEVVSFVDDDNWVCAEWVEGVAEVMSRHCQVGACGGLAQAKPEIEPPWWFDLHKECYAVGPQGDQAGDITWSRGYVWGAGLTVRKSAWQELASLGFSFLLADRRGTALDSGGDRELCLALRLAGWRLWYEPRPNLHHYLPASRLRWKHLRQLVRGFGAAYPFHKAYYLVQEGRFRAPTAWLAYWQCQASVSVIKLIWQFCKFLLTLPYSWEGNPAVLDIASRMGEVYQMLQLRTAYNANVQRVRETFHKCVPQLIGFHCRQRASPHFISHPQFDEATVLGREESWPRITVVTLSYNQGKYLEQTILSVLNQNYPNLEFIIMDGGSTDHSVETIRKYEKYLAHWESKPDGGQAAAIADGFRLASGDILAYLNSDDVYLPGALRKVGEFFKQYKTAEFMYGDCLIIDSHSRVIRRLYPMEFDREIFFYDNAIIPQQAAFWRRHLYRRVGEMNRTLQFCMDLDLWTKFMEAGVDFVRVKEVLAAFRWHSDSKTARLKHVHDKEYGDLFQKVMGKPLDWRDSFKVSYLRLKRYCQEPRGLLEGIKSRFGWTA